MKPAEIAGLFLLFFLISEMRVFGVTSESIEGTAGLSVYS